MGTFRAVPELLKARSGDMFEHSRLFAENVTKIYNTVEEMKRSNFISPDAVALANEIEKYHGDMNRMAKIIAEYAQFLANYSGAVVQNQADNISRIKIN